jgi:hypothetical protein
MYIVKARNYQLYAGELMQDELPTYSDKSKAYKFASKKAANTVVFALCLVSGYTWEVEQVS